MLIIRDYSLFKSIVCGFDDEELAKLFVERYGSDNLVITEVNPRDDSFGPYLYYNEFYEIRVEIDYIGNVVDQKMIPAELDSLTYANEKAFSTPFEEVCHFRCRVDGETTLALYCIEGSLNQAVNTAKQYLGVYLRDNEYPTLSKGETIELTKKR